MYQPPAFKETREDVMLEAINEHPLATLVSHSDDGIVANHLPMVVEQHDSKLFLNAHLARANNLIDACPDGQEALAIFQGPAHYISASLYPSKKIDGKVVPTYNYVVVHARGILRYKHDLRWKLGHLNALTDNMEAGRAEPWAVSDAPADFLARQLKGIYGLELEVTDLVGKWKVSQNRKDADKHAVADGLETETTASAPAMASLVRPAN